MTKDEAREAAELEYFDGREENESNYRDFNKFRAGFNAGYEYANRWNVIERDGLPTGEATYEITDKYGRLDSAYINPVDEQICDAWHRHYVAWKRRSEPYKGE